MNGTSVAKVFEHHRENLFRGKETDAIKKLSSMYRVVVSTGGGTVIRPINWKYMHKGISIWLDVPLEALAHRIAAVGTDLRPLLHDESRDAYIVAFKRLLTIWDERGEAYTNANARVSLENIAFKHGYKDVSDLTPGEIAIEAFEQIQRFLEKEETMVIPDSVTFNFLASNSVTSFIRSINSTKQITHHQTIQQVESFLDKEDLLVGGFWVIRAYMTLILSVENHQQCFI